VRKALKDSKRIVVKIGTSSLLHANGKVHLKRIDELAYVITNLINEGREILLVTSGAIGVAMGQLQLTARPKEIASQQALAAIGQAELVNIYKQRFSTYAQKIAQILLTRDIMDYHPSRDNVNNTLNSLLKMGVLPIINENDTVSVDELDHLTSFGDNDLLSVIVSIVSSADLLIILSDVDGFYDQNPMDFPKATKYVEINEITEDLLKRAGSSSGSSVGTGGMFSKLTAAQKLMDNDGKLVIALGDKPAVIQKILDGEPIGTLFCR